MHPQYTARVTAENAMETATWKALQINQNGIPKDVHMTPGKREKVSKQPNNNKKPGENEQKTRVKMADLRPDISAVTPTDMV